VAASNNRVHIPWSLYYCLFAPHISMVLFFAYIPFVVNHAINATPPERLQQWRTIWRALPFVNGMGRSRVSKQVQWYFGNIWTTAPHFNIYQAINTEYLFQEWSFETNPKVNSSLVIQGTHLCVISKNIYECWQHLMKFTKSFLQCFIYVDFVSGPFWKIVPLAQNSLARP